MVQLARRPLFRKAPQFFPSHILAAKSDKLCGYFTLLSPLSQLNPFCHITSSGALILFSLYKKSCIKMFLLCVFHGSYQLNLIDLGGEQECSTFCGTSWGCWTAVDHVQNGSTCTTGNTDGKIFYSFFYPGSNGLISPMPDLYIWLLSCVVYSLAQGTGGPWRLSRRSVAYLTVASACHRNSFQEVGGSWNF